MSRGWRRSQNKQYFVFYTIVDVLNFEIFCHKLLLTIEALDLVEFLYVSPHFPNESLISVERIQLHVSCVCFPRLGTDSENVERKMRDRAFPRSVGINQT